MKDSNLHPVFKDILDSQLSIHSVSGSSSNIEDVPFNCPGEYHECVCNDCAHLETEQAAHPGGGLSTVDKNKCGWGYWEDDF